MAEFKIRRPGATDFWINDLSQLVGASSTIDLYPLHGGFDLSNSLDLKVAINIGDLIRVKNSLDVPANLAFKDLILTGEHPDISASEAESEAEEARSWSSYIAYSWSSIAKSQATRSQSIAIRGESYGRRADSIGRIYPVFDPAEIQSIANLAYSYGYEGDSIGDRAESLARDILTGLEGGRFFGSYFYADSGEEVSSTTGIDFIEKLKLNVTNLPSGYNYRIGWFFEFAYASSASEFRGRLQLDDTTDIMLMDVRPTPADPDKFSICSGFAYTQISGNHFFDIDFCSSSLGKTAYIRRARLEFWRSNPIV